jgi:tyrosinase
VRLRRNIALLNAEELARFIGALRNLKAAINPETGKSRYDELTEYHARGMMLLTRFSGEKGTGRNAGHKGPAFLPWHRRALCKLELALGEQGIDPWWPLPTEETPEPVPPAVELAIPYWRWNNLGTTWGTSLLWSIVGGNGSAADGYRVIDGPFADWVCTIYNSSTAQFEQRQPAGIIRNFRLTTSTGSATAFPTLGATTITRYDLAPWSESSTLNNTSWRRYFEIRHNKIHELVRGDMIAVTSPNDPVFWLHHSNCDRAWARWQKVRGVTNLQGNYQPDGVIEVAPLGHNRPDLLLPDDGYPLWPTIADTLDWKAMGYDYDTTSP